GVSAQAFLDLRIDAMDYLAIGVGLFVVFLIDLLKEKNRFDVEKLFTMKTPAKWAICYALIFSVIIFGAYGDGYGDVALIYAGF
ncbi:MAG: MBOAT family protein, partial [Lachnospiraceae bacterium]|nr:MBOAT family protein [Lachnospiraceae bacterium]